MGGRRAIAPAVSALSIALLAPTWCPAAIEPGRGIGGAELDMSAKEVRQALGPPGSRYERRTAWGRAFVYRYPGRRLRVTFAAANSRAVRVTTRNARERTARGLGVGSTEKRVRRTLRRERCNRPERPRFCFTGANSATQTVYYFREGRVSFVSVELSIGVE